MKPKSLFVIAFLSLCLLSGCSRQQEGQESQQNTEADLKEDSASKEIFAMDTYMTVTTYGEKCEEAVAAAAEEITRLDALLSTGSDNSEITAINRQGGGSLSEDTVCLIEKSIELYKDTEGAFDITIYPVMKAWGFAGGDFGVPSETELSRLLKLVDASAIDYDSENKQIAFEKENMEIDLGGIAKGYTSSRIVEIFQSFGIESGMINLGGNVQLLGKKVNGEKWRVAIQNPNRTDEYLGVVSTEDKAVITSGGYERYFEEDGETYHHIIDPSTGYPANNGLTSVTVVCEDGMMADGLSTSLFVMGTDKAIAFWKNHSDQFDAVFMTEEGIIYVTEGISSDFISDLDIQIVRKD